MKVVKTLLVLCGGMVLGGVATVACLVLMTAGSLSIETQPAPIFGYGPAPAYPTTVPPPQTPPTYYPSAPPSSYESDPNLLLSAPPELPQLAPVLATPAPDRQIVVEDIAAIRRQLGSPVAEKLQELGSDEAEVHAAFTDELQRAVGVLGASSEPLTNDLPKFEQPVQETSPPLATNFVPSTSVSAPVSALRQAARVLDGLANDAEATGNPVRADQLSARAAELRKEARELAGN